MRNLARSVQIKALSESQALSRVEFKPNHRILVVDDEREILQSYLDILSPQGEQNVVPIRSSRALGSQPLLPRSEFEVVVAKSFDEALAIVKIENKNGRPFAMGFFDVLLGEGPDGFELVKQIHEIDERMFAVFVTAYHDRSVDSIQKFFGSDKTNRWDYLSKPFSNGEILQKARNFISLWNLSEEKKIHDEKLAEAQRRLMDNEKMASIAAVARGVSHEFGNLLMQIMGKADVCLNENNPEKMKAGMEVILQATQRANDILEKFKDLSNPSHGQDEKVSLEVHSLVDEVFSLMEHKIKTSQLKITRIKTDKVAVLAHPTALMQVFVNLTLNAIDAMGAGGQLDVAIVEHQAHVEVRFRDYGPGIKKEWIDKVMEPFFTTKGRQGTGLGLPICREIIEVDHEGEFILQNHGVKGLEAIIRLPKGTANGGVP